MNKKKGRKKRKEKRGEERSGHAQNRIDAAGRLDPLEATVRCGAMRCGVWRVNQLLYKDGSEDALHCTALMLLPSLMRRARSRKEKKRKKGHEEEEEEESR